MVVGHWEQHPTTATQLRQRQLPLTDMLCCAAALADAPPCAGSVFTSQRQDGVVRLHATTATVLLTHAVGTVTGARL